MTSETNPREALIRIIEKLPLDKIRVILEIGRAMEFEVEHQPDQKQYVSGTIDSLKRITGIIGLGGDAVEDTDKYWE